MPTIELLIGMIASGKSTYALTRARAGALVVCHDDLTEMLHAEYRYEPGLREAYRYMEEAVVLEILRAGRDVVIDRTHLTLESRGRWVNMAAQMACPIVAVTFPESNPDSHAIRRFSHDARGRTLSEWLTVARHHAGQAEAEPLDWRAEGFDARKDVAGPRPA